MMHATNNFDSNMHNNKKIITPSEVEGVGESDGFWDVGESH